MNKRKKERKKERKKSLKEKEIKPGEGGKKMLKKKKGLKKK